MTDGYRPFIYLWPAKWWCHVRLPYFTIGLWLFSFGVLRGDDE